MSIQQGQKQHEPDQHVIATGIIKSGATREGSAADPRCVSACHVSRRSLLFPANESI